MPRGISIPHDSKSSLTIEDGNKRDENSIRILRIFESWGLKFFNLKIPLPLNRTEFFYLVEVTLIHDFLRAKMKMVKEIYFFRKTVLSCLMVALSGTMQNSKPFERQDKFLSRTICIHLYISNSITSEKYIYKIVFKIE